MGLNTPFCIPREISVDNLEVQPLLGHLSEETMLLPWDVFRHHLKNHHGTLPLVVVVGLGTALSASYTAYCLYTSPDIRLWRRQRLPRYEQVDPAKSKTVWTVKPLTQRTGPAKEMEVLAHEAIGPHQYLYGTERQN